MTAIFLMYNSVITIEWRMRMKKGFLYVLLITAVITLFSGCSANNAGQTIKVEEAKEKAQDEPQNLYIIRSNGYYIYIDSKGNKAIDNKFEDAMNFSEELAAVRIKDKYGYIDKKGDIVISPQFDYVRDFKDGLACVTLDNKTGFINKSGEYVIPLSDKYIMDFSEGLAAVNDGNLYGYIDKNGKTVILPMYHYAGDFSEGLAPVNIEEKYGFIDKTGVFVVQPKFEYLYCLSEGLAAFSKDGKYGYVNAKGEEIIPPQFQYAFEFSEGLACIQDAENKYGYIDKEGNIVIKPSYEVANSFKNGLAVAISNSKSGYINTKGEFVIEPKFDYAYPFLNEYTIANFDGDEVLIDKKGNIVFEPDREIEVVGQNGAIGKLIKKKVKRDKFDVTIKYPQFISRSEDSNNKEIEKEINEVLSFVFDIGYEGFEGETMSEDYNIELNKNGIMSINSNTYTYSGGAHGMSYLVSLNIDMESGKLFELKDLFRKDSNYKEKLNSILIEQAKEKGDIFIGEYNGITPEQQFYLTENELVLYYQLYEYTPYAYGFLKFYIPYSDIKDLIDEESPIQRIVK